ncbi:MAG: hypothetical protein ABSH33_15715 [Steroidobacteraceae bacterium]|jgi:hypothetical protein
MSEETSRPTCPFKLTGPYVPPRFQQGPITTALNLGPLAFLAGSWRGLGFNAIWRPDNPQSRPLTAPANPTKRLLELNLTNDSFDFHVIPGVVPNRGLNPQTDLSLYGLHYLQRTSDADPAPSKKVLPPGYSTTAGQALHIEPGLFMNVPAAPGTIPPVPATIVRMGSIPHGVTVLMQGPTPEMKPRHGKPHIPHLRPFSSHGNVYPGLSPMPFPGAYPGTNVPLPLPPGTPNPPGVGIQPVELDAAGPVPAGGQHVVPEININADVLVPNQPPLPGPLPAPLPGPPGPPAPSPLSYQSSGPFPDSFQGFIDDPNSVLRDALEGQEILGFIEINLTTDSQSLNGIPTLGVGSLFETVSNIPFLGVANQTQNPAPVPLPVPPAPPYQPATLAIQPNTTPNAFVYSASATFWIEWVRLPDYPVLKTDPGPAMKELEPFWPEGTYLQLQYSQLVILVFNNVLWPHVTVATMTLSAG